MAEVRASRCHHQAFCRVSTKSPAAESNSPRKECFMERAIQPLVQLLSKVESAQNELGMFSSESVLNILKLIFAGSPLPEVLTIIARLVESQGEGMFCTIWLPDEEGKHLDCVAAPSLPGFSAHVGHGNLCEWRILRHSCLSEGAGVCDRHPH